VIDTVEAENQVDEQFRKTPMEILEEAAQATNANAQHCGSSVQPTKGMHTYIYT
jgi:hypothetical protein